MQFFSPVDILKSDIAINHSKGVVLIGSCFADNIGSCMKEAKFNVLANPFGTLYNPLSIKWVIEQSLESRTFCPPDQELFQDGEGTWHSWMHHSDFSSQSAEELCLNINKAGDEMRRQLQTAGTLIVTFGTAIVYTLKENGHLVANCHKQKDNLFERKRLKTEEITEAWSDLLRQLHELNPALQVILTVSPIRHQRDGLHTNQLSKATLLLATDQLVSSSQGKDGYPHLEYFPSYEIMMDELRDYRFYADDMTHPSPIAVQYIWERFSRSHFSKVTEGIIDSCKRISKALNHRPSRPDSTVYKAFIADTLKQIQTLTNNHPYINMEKETEKCNTLLEK